MQFKLAPIGILSLTIGLSSCLQMEQKAIVNPDGSGSFTVEQKMNINAIKGMVGGLGLPGGADAIGKKDPAKDAKEAHGSLVKMISSARGVDVWTDASSRTDADGTMVTRVSGYCKDITRLNISGGDSSGGAKMQGMDNLMSLEKSTDASGNLVLEVPLEKLFMEQSKQENKEGGTPKTPAERKAKRMQETQQMDMMAGMMGAMMKDAKMTFYYNFGQGEILEHGAFKLINPNTVSLEFKPMEMIAAFGKIMKDEKLGEILDASAEFDPKNPEHKKVIAALAEGMYGKNGLPRVVIKPKGNAINYAEASGKAKAAQSAELKTLLKEAEEAAKSAAENPFGRSLK